MKTQLSFLALAALPTFLAASVLGAAGCATPCNHVVSTERSTGAALSVSLSMASGGSGSTPVNEITTAFYAAAATPAGTKTLPYVEDCAAAKDGCLELSVAAPPSMITMQVHLQTPPSPGSYRLEDLGASFCDYSTCTAITGTLDVRAIARPCGDGACGKVDADLVVDAATPGTPPVSGPTISGHATLVYSETFHADQCATQLPEGG